MFDQKCVVSSPNLDSFFSVCALSVYDYFNDPQPFFKMVGAGREHAIIDGAVRLARGKKVEVCCPDQCVVHTCIGDHIFRDPFGVEVDGRDWACHYKHAPAAVKTPVNCFYKGMWVRGGLFFSGPKKQFVDLFQVCWDQRSATPVMVVHEFNRTHLRQQPRIKCRRRWLHRGYFEGIRDPNKMFSKQTSFNTIARLLGDTRIARKIVDPNSKDRFLSKGHMAPKSDFVFAPDKIGTCSLVSSRMFFD